MIVRTPEELPLDASITTGFVPTMGALHPGHLSLIRRAKHENDRVIVSVFVNPTQFGPSEDFSRYPRPFEKDVELATDAGADVIFAPEVATMYSGTSCTINVPGVTELFEGALRPGHFEGVATVVSKLFHIVRPDKAYFGKKDLQQCAVIKKMVDDLNERVLTVFCDTLRESDGLAMSSRNIYLTKEERELAPQLYAKMNAIRSSFLETGFNLETVNQAKNELNALGFQVQYLELVDWSTMHPTQALDNNSYLIVAAKLGTTRLIDNLEIIR